jgi:hypothetical protein
MPGLLMILLGSCILLFPQLLPAVVAGFFILSGLLLVQTMRRLRMVVTHIRKNLERQGEESAEQIPYGLLPHRVYTSWIN